MWDYLPFSFILCAVFHWPFRVGNIFCFVLSLLHRSNSSWAIEQSFGRMSLPRVLPTTGLCSSVDGRAVTFSISWKRSCSTSTRVFRSRDEVGNTDCCQIICRNEWLQREPLWLLWLEWYWEFSTDATRGLLGGSTNARINILLIHWFKLELHVLVSSQ